MAMQWEAGVIYDPGQGQALPLLIRWLHVVGDGSEEREINKAH